MHTPRKTDVMFDYCAGDVPSAVDFMCKLTCKTGIAEVQTVTNLPLPPAGIFNPPYAINVNLTQVPISTKVSSCVCSSHIKPSVPNGVEMSRNNSFLDHQPLACSHSLMFCLSKFPAQSSRLFRLYLSLLLATSRPSLQQHAIWTEPWNITCTTFMVIPQQWLHTEPSVTSTQKDVHFC